jgi:hypothetical protein
MPKALLFNKCLYPYLGLVRTPGMVSVNTDTSTKQLLSIFNVKSDTKGG